MKNLREKKEKKKKAMNNDHQKINITTNLTFWTP